MVYAALYYASRYSLLKALCFAVWTAFHPMAARAPHAAAIADAIANAVMADPNPIGSEDEEAALAARWAVEESWLRPRVVGDGGQAHGLFQLHRAAGLGSIGTQTQAWLAMLHDGSKVCPESPAAPLSGGCVQARKLADRRTRAALGVLHQFLASSSLSSDTPIETSVDSPEGLLARGGQNSGL
jgi:hypothetical protein